MNSKGRWTPGPWTIRETRDGMTIRKSRRRLEIVAPCEGGGEMVIVGEHTGLDCLRSANARLIAAAPELLEALYKIDANAAESAEWIRRVTRAAIAKAEGREGE